MAALYNLMNIINVSVNKLESSMKSLELVFKTPSIQRRAGENVLFSSDEVGEHLVKVTYK